MTAVVALAALLLAGLAALRAVRGPARSVEAPDADRPRGRWPWLWAGWAVVAFGGFWVLEGPALLNDTGGDTLTEQIQWLGGYAPVLLVVVVVGVAAWFVDHFVGSTSRIWRMFEWRRRRTGRKPGGRLSP
jgi:hypothetical protein